MPTNPEFQPKFKLSQDHVDLLSLLNAHGAKYLLVGGYVVGAYSEPRATKDLDLYVLCTSENSKVVFRALAEFGAPLSGLTPDDFCDPKTWYQMGLPPERVDVLKLLSGVTFEECWETRVRGLVNGEVEVPVISFDKLIANKLASGRPRDLIDVAEMRRAALLVKERPKL